MIYSMERRRERHMIMFMHKIVLGIYPNPGFDPSTFHFDDRSQSIRVMPKHVPSAEPRVQRLRSASFFAKGPKLYEAVLSKIGGVEHILEPTEENLAKFKSKLDELLEAIPDEPGEGGHRNAATNSILDQIHHRRTEEEVQKRRPAYAKKKATSSHPSTLVHSNNNRKFRSRWDPDCRISELIL